ncbi:SRPBCC family protein [Azospirillum thermophilum]|uniref:MxaD family protein n=1 Tax=Azospirillum thermophilum TaxID=2202148 RepID=A0A2S2CYW5_9PROT|nr:SRPBCC family protein [Azospirillum thermophilum]AWK89679.1 MxaD family protein [Azospirillum thermophilum]
MVLVHCCAPVDASAATVWSRIGDFAALSAWHPAVTASPLEQDGPADRPGCVRALSLANGAAIREQLLEHDAAGRLYRYSIVESPLPVEGYTATLQVVSTGADSARIDWTARFQAADADAEGVAKALGEVFATGLAAVAAELKGAVAA